MSKEVVFLTNASYYSPHAGIEKSEGHLILELERWIPL